MLISQIVFSYELINFSTRVTKNEGYEISRYATDVDNKIFIYEYYIYIFEYLNAYYDYIL